MSRWANVPLSELIRPTGRRAGNSADAPVYSVTKHNGFVPSLDYFKKQVFSRDLSSYKLVEPGDFAYATIHLDEGSIGIAPERALISPMYSAFRVDGSKVDPGYLLRYMKSGAALAAYSTLGSGSVHRRMSISISAVGKVQIPLPPLDEQRRIAAVLDHVNFLRHKREQTLLTVDSIDQSILRKFSSAKSERDLRDLGVEFTAGKSVVGIGSEADENRRIVKVSAVSSGRFQTTESKALPVNYRPSPTHRVHPGDLLITRASGSEDLIGVTAIVPSGIPELYLPDKVWRVEISDEGLCCARYLHSVFRSRRFRRYISDVASGASGVKNVSKSKFLNFRFPFAKIDDQRHFSDTVRWVDMYRVAAERHAVELDALFAALQSRAFSGDLDVSKVALPSS